MESYDLVVIGAGPGGYVGAIRAAQRGLKVALVEKEKVGGTCLHRGCIPSKAYLAAAEAVETARRGEKIGVSLGPPGIDYAKVVRGKDDKVRKLEAGIQGLLKGNGVDLIQGEGRLTSKNQVAVGGEIVSAKNILLATGTEPVRPSLFPFDGEKVITTDELFRLTTLPRRLLVVGAGVIGCEMACAYNLLGSEVTLVELLPEILPQEGGGVSKTLRGIFERRGIQTKTGMKVEKVEKGETVVARLSSGETIETDVALVAIGRKVGEDRLGASDVGIKLENGFVSVDEKMETSVPGIFAVGDLAGKTLLAHGAMAEGICAVENMVGNPQMIDYDSIPRVTYTIPEVASVGKKGGKAGRSSYLANGMAILHEETDGFAETYVGEDRKVAGAVAIGAHASDLIQEVALVMRNRLKIDALTHTVHAHPTISEIIHEAAEDSLGLAIHKLGRK